MLKWVGVSDLKGAGDINTESALAHFPLLHVSPGLATSSLFLHNQALLAKSTLTRVKGETNFMTTLENIYTLS